jgi:hypothetical protein
MVKSRKVGNSRVLTIPKELDDGKVAEYEVFRSEDGAYLFLPAFSNPFKDGTADVLDLRMTDEFAGVRLLDSEIE